MPIQDDFTALIYTSKLSIGSIVPDCVVEETYEDTTQITSHPVEKGANMSDHAFMLPMSVDMKIAWADYKGKNTRWSRDKYLQLLSIQAQCEPLTVYTGKRKFDNMMIVGVSVTNDQKTKHAVMATVRLKEIRQADVVTSFEAGPPADAQSSPQSTQGQTNKGPVTPAPTGLSQAPPTEDSEDSEEEEDSPPDSTKSVLSPTPAPPQ
jgi:hypothetical protein